MKLPDVNLLIYAIDKSSPNHEAAHGWWRELLSGSETVALAWPVLTAFVRLVIQPAVFHQPLEVNVALDYIDSWLEQPCTVIVHPRDRHSQLSRGLLEPLGAGGNLIADAHLAALAREHGAELCSCDTDFARFAGLNWVNPLN